VAKEPKRDKAGSTRQPFGAARESGGLNERLLNALVSISGCATLEEALEPLLNTALDVTKMDGGGVYWVEGDVAALRHHRGLPEGFIREVTRMSLTPPPVQTLLHQQEPVELAEISSAMRVLFGKYGIQHAFSFPLRARGVLFGFLNVGSTQAEAPEKADLQALWVLVKETESLFFRLYSEKAVRESEERYRTLWESARDGILLHELLVSLQPGRFLDANDGLCRILGYTHEEILTLSLLDIVTEEEKKTVHEQAARVRRAGRMLFETTLVAKNGRRIPVEVNAGVVRLGERQMALAIVRDVTERKRMEVLLQQTNEHLEEQVQTRTQELNHTIDQLQSAMKELEHHAAQLQKLTLEVVQAEDRERRRLAEFLHDDLQQTLAAAKFHLSILAGRIGNEGSAGEILEQIKQMLKEAIEKTRNLSHELGPPALYGSKLDAVFEWLAGQMESKHGLTVQVEICGGADSQSAPVRSFLYRTAQEILFNTAKHAQIRAARLRLQRVRDELWLTISDRGRGFDPASLAQTTGCGLLNIRERVELLGGRMTIKSAPGRGSIFFVTVPDPVAPQGCSP
jgi:two-component system sensor histidine kinase DegS